MLLQPRQFAAVRPGGVASARRTAIRQRGFRAETATSAAPNQTQQTRTTTLDAFLTPTPGASRLQPWRSTTDTILQMSPGVDISRTLHIQQIRAYSHPIITARPSERAEYHVEDPLCLARLATLDTAQVNAGAAPLYEADGAWASCELLFTCSHVFSCTTFVYAAAGPAACLSVSAAWRCGWRGGPQRWRL